MNEAAAREVLLVRAIESTDAAQALLTPTDREHAGRAAAELARWQAAEQRVAADADRLLAQRARLLLERLGERSRAARAAGRALAWRPWIGIALPAAALVAGPLFERIGDRGHVNVLAFPLLALLLWNVAVYLLLAVGWLVGRVRRAPAGRALPGLRSALLRLAQRAAPRAAGPLAPALGRFVDDWLAASAPLMGARIARTLHLAAALFALGAIAGLYVRGLVFDYRAGWESTFLDASAVQALLAAVLGPAAHLLGQGFPGVEEIAALRFGPGAAGESAARWIHWYALTVGGVVVLPRLLLAALGAWRAHRLARSFPLDLSAPYFRRLLAGFGAAAACVRALPFSYTLDAAAADGLRALARQLFGASATLRLQPALAFGEETRAAQALALDTAAAAVDLDLAVFNLAATPEPENHGAFLAVLGPAASAHRAALVDEGPYRRRLGAQAGGAARLAERRAAWRAFAATQGWAVVFADLAAPDLAQLERDLGPLLGRP
jgi:hypothetical protein